VDSSRSYGFDDIERHGRSRSVHQGENVVTCPPGGTVMFNNVAFEMATSGATRSGAGVVLMPVDVT
jgi:hypothetical protein